jgi:hypothetical protein
MPMSMPMATSRKSTTISKAGASAVKGGTKGKPANAAPKATTARQTLGTCGTDKAGINANAPPKRAAAISHRTHSVSQTSAGTVIIGHLPQFAG